MIGLPRRDPAIAQRMVPESKVKWLGDPVAGHQYAMHDGREYQVELHSADPGAFTPQPGELVISRRKLEMVDGTPWESTGYFRAFLVKPGTHDRLVAKVRKPDAEKPLRAWDRLATLRAMQRREPQRIVAGPQASSVDMLPALPAQPSDEEQALIAGTVDLAERGNPRTLVEVGGHQPPQRSVAAMVDYLASRGVELSLIRGRLLAKSRTPIRTDDRELVEQARELIVGHLRGQPVICGECAAPAVGIRFPDSPACGTHLEAGQ